MKVGVIDTLLEHLPKDNINQVLADKLKRFKFKWGTKDQNYIEFLSSGLIGVHPIRFSEHDEDELFIDILNIDRDNIQHEYYKCYGINKSFKVSSNATNLTLMGLIHLYYMSNLPVNKKLDAMRDIYNIMCYKFIGSMYSHFFRYDVSIHHAKAVYESLSNKFIIKQVGTWDNLFNHQYDIMMPPHGLHKGRLTTGKDEDLVRMINDAQVRVKDTLKNIRRELENVKESDFSSINTSSLHETINGKDGEADTIREVHEGYNNYSMFLKSIYNQPNDFIKKDYILVMSKLIRNTDERKLELALKELSLRETKIDPKFDYISIIIESCISYLMDNGISSGYRDKIVEVMKLIVGYYKANKQRDKRVYQVKVYFQKFIRKHVHGLTQRDVVPISISMCVYIFLRAIAKD